MSKTWKSVELRIAKAFGTARTPLSGSNSRHTSSDTLHSKLYIEIKHGSSSLVTTIYGKMTKNTLLVIPDDRLKGELLAGVHNDTFT